MPAIRAGRFSVVSLPGSLRLWRSWSPLPRYPSTLKLLENHQAKAGSKDGMSNACAQQYFQHRMIFRLVLIKKKCLPTTETSITVSLDIKPAAPRKTCLIFSMSAEKGWETPNYYQHKQTTVSAIAPAETRILWHASVQHSILQFVRK